MLQGEEIIRAYFAAWNQNDPKIRRMLLERCCAEDAVILIGGRQISGRTEIDVSIARFRRDCPDDVGELTSGIDMVGNWCCFPARVVRPDGTSYSGERMPVHAVIAVAGRRRRKPVRRVEAEFLVDLHVVL